MAFNALLQTVDRTLLSFKYCLGLIIVNIELVYVTPQLGCILELCFFAYIVSFQEYSRI